MIRVWAFTERFVNALFSEGSIIKLMIGICILAGMIGMLVGVGCMCCIKAGAIADMELQYMFEGTEE